MQPCGIHPCHIINLDYLSDKIHILTCLRSTILGCKDLGIRKSDFVA